MGMIGNQLAPGTQFAVTNDSYNGDGSTTAFTLSQSVSATTDIEVIVDNVQQSPYDGSYSVSGTALTFSGAPSAGTNNIYVIYHGSKHHTTAQVIPDDGSVHSSKIADLAVTHAKLHTDMDLSAKNVNPITMSTGTDKMQLAIQSAVSNRFALRSTHTADYDNNPFIVYQPSSAGVQNDALVITADGYILKNKQPAFRVGKTSSDTSSGGNFIDPITFQQTDFNIGNHFNLSTNKFTAPVAGRYLFTWSVSILRNSAAYTGVYSYVNNTYLDWTNSFQYSAPSWFPHDSSIIVNLAVNDTFHIVGRHDSNASIDNSGWFSGILLG